MAGHGRSKNDTSFAHGRAIQVLASSKFQDVDARHKAGHDEQ
jgi:hypothetical protein